MYNHARGVFYNMSSIEKRPAFSFKDALAMLLEEKRAKFNETVEIAINLDTKLTDVPVRGFVDAPNGLGRDIPIAVFCDSKIDGVAYCGGEELIEKFAKGEIKKCKVCIATKKYVPLISAKIGKILGRKRIMPDARFGTVVEDEPGILRTVECFRKGRMNFRANKNVIHCILGKVDFKADALEENFTTLIKEISGVLPPKTRIGSSYISSTMSKKSFEVKVGNI